MAKNRQQKAEQISAISQQLTNKGVVLFSHAGLKVNELETLRKQLRTEQGTIIVSKRNLLLKALAEHGLQAPAGSITGAVAVAAGPDEVAPAKVVAAFKKTHEAVQFIGGVLEQSFISAEQVSALANVPSRPELLAKAVGSIAAPLSGFVNVLAGNLRGLVNVLNGIKDKKAA